MKNPLVVFTGLALASLAALIAVTTQRSGEAPQPEPKVAVNEPATGQKPVENQPAKSEVAAKPEDQPAAEPAKPAEEKPAEAKVEPQIEPKPAEAKVEQKAAEPVKTPEPTLTENEPKPADSDSKSTAASKAPAKPEFDTVRVEPDGNAIVAGQAEPGSEVTLKLDGLAIGKGVANEEGAWVVVPEVPLPKGSHEITAEQKVAEAGAPVVSDQSIAVAMPEDGTKQPMIAMLEPGAATKVIQKSESAGEQQTAAAEPPAPKPEAETQPEAKPEEAKPKAEQQTAAGEQPQPEVQPEETKPKVEQQIAAAEPPAAKPEAKAEPEAKPEETKPKVEQQVAAVEPPQEAKPKSEEAVPAEKTVTEPAAEEPTAQPIPEPLPEEKKQAALPEPEEATAPPKKEPKAAEPLAIPLSLDVVDYNDRGDIIFSGRATAGAAIRLYVDNQPVGDVLADANGGWSFSGSDLIAPGTHMLRADQIDAAGKVVSRIELPFLREDSKRVATLTESDKAVQPPAEPTIEEPVAPKVAAPAEPTVEPPAEPKIEAPAEAKVEPPPKTKVEPPAEAKVEPPPETKVEPPAEAKVEPPPETKVEPPAEAKVESPPETKVEPPAEAKVEPPASQPSDQTEQTAEQQQPPPAEEPKEEPKKVEVQPEPQPEAAAEAQVEPAPPAKTEPEAEPKVAELPPKPETEVTKAAPEPETKATQTAPESEATGSQEEFNAAAKAEAAGAAGDSGGVAKPRTGRVVIQPRNNLWKLSRVIYGRGVHYTVIYAANKEQIRNPDLIYPGQIFTIPNATPPEAIDPKRKLPLTEAEGGGTVEEQVRE